MKILIATGIYPPDIGGPATYSKLLMDELPKRGIGTSVLSFGEVRSLPKLIRHAVYFFKLLKRLRGVDAVFAQDTVSVGLPALVASRISGKKFYIRVPGDYAWEQSAQRFGVKDTIDEFQTKKYGLKIELLRLVQTFVVNNADLVFTPSIYFKKLVGAWCDDPSKVHHIYNGIQWPKQLLSRTEARREFGMSTDDIVVISVGRLVSLKGFEGVIRTAESLVKKSTRYKFYIVGDGPERTRLQSLVTDKNIGEFVVLAGSVSRQEVFAYLVAADVFVLNSSSESFSFQIIEAMFCRAPIVAARTGAIPEIIEDKSEGVLVDHNNVEAIAAAIEVYVSDQEYRSRIVENAYAKSLRFSIEGTVNKLVSYLV